jgi:hypothetical protein
MKKMLKRMWIRLLVNNRPKKTRPIRVFKSTDGGRITRCEIEKRKNNLSFFEYSFDFTKERAELFDTINKKD